MHLRDLKLDLGKDYTVTWEVKGSERFDCYPEEDSDEAKCKARGCIWKVRWRDWETAFSIQPRCGQRERLIYIYIDRCLVDVTFAVSFRFLIVVSFICNSGFLLSVQPSDVPKEPWCFYPVAYGYTASNLMETQSGWTLDLDRNTAFPSPRSLSPDINKLRVEITYLSGHSLRWKVRIQFIHNKTKTYFEIT